MGSFENECHPTKNDKKSTPSNFPITSALTQGYIPCRDSPHPRIQYSGPLQRIHTQNQESTTRQIPQEHTSQDILSSHGTTTVTRPPTECDLRHQRILPPPPRDIFIKTNKRKHSHTKRNRDVCPEQWVRTIRSLAQSGG